MVNLRAVLKRLGQFFLPILVSALVISLMWLTVSMPVFQIAGLLMLGYFVSPFGREVLIPGAVMSLIQLHGMGHMLTDLVLVVGIVVFVDIMCSIFLLWNLDLLKFLPVIGRWIEGVESFGRQRLKKSRRKRQDIFLALTGYVALPFQGSGGIMSTIIGMLSGMGKERVWISVWLGSFAGSVIIGILSFTLGETLIDVFGSGAWSVLGICLMAAIFIRLAWNYKNA